MVTRLLNGFIHQGVEKGRLSTADLTDNYKKLSGHKGERYIPQHRIVINLNFELGLIPGLACLGLLFRGYPEAPRILHILKLHVRLPFDGLRPLGTVLFQT